MSQLNGRVFSRLQQYDALPAALKQEAERLEEYLASNQTELFSAHRTMTLKSVFGVRTRALLDKIEAWVKEHGTATGGDAHTGHTEGHTASSLKEKVKDLKEHIVDHGTTHEDDRRLASAHENVGEQHHHTAGTGAAGAPQSNVGNYQTATSGTPASAPVPLVKPTDPSAGAHIPQAKKLLDALVLKGFVTPHKEDKVDETPSAIEDLDLKDSELLVAVGKRIVPKNSTPTVWDLVDGAVFAGLVKRKAGILAPLTGGKDEYAVVNARTNNLTLFASDLGRDPVLQLSAEALEVSFDKSHYENGVKVWNATGAELLDLSNAQESDALVHALLAIGAVQSKENGPDVKSINDKIRDKVKAVTTDTHMSDSTTHSTHEGHGAHSGLVHDNKAAGTTGGMHNQENLHHGHGVQGASLPHDTQGMKSDNLQHGTQGMTGGYSHPTPTDSQTMGHSMDPTQQHGMKSQYGTSLPTHNSPVMHDTTKTPGEPMQSMTNQEQAWTNDKLQQQTSTHRGDGVNEPTHYAP